MKTLNRLIYCWVKKKKMKKERGRRKGNLPKEANSNAKLILTMSEILKRTSQEERKKERNVETKNQKPEVEMETEKMIAVNTRLCAKTGLMIKPLENRDPHWKKQKKQKPLSLKTTSFHLYLTVTPKLPFYPYFHCFIHPHLKRLKLYFSLRR